MNKLFAEDYYRMTGKRWSLRSGLHLLYRHDLRYLKHLRSGKSGLIFRIASIYYGQKYGLEILTANIGRGLYLGHAQNINVHPDVVIGNNCNLSKGCTIGRENRGKRNGAPVLGDRVWVGTNAVVVGNIRVGSDVLIAPNAYVNMDVPDHSIVVGNPGVIKVCSGLATEHYIENIIED